jgi:hypothetical protein
MPTELVDAVSQLLNDCNEWVATAAAQNFLSWIVLCDLRVKLELVYKAAANATNESMGREYRALFRALPKALSFQYPLPVSILLNNRNLAFHASHIQLVTGARWRFPQLEVVLVRVKDIVLPAMQDSLAVLGCVVKLLGVNVE